MSANTETTGVKVGDVFERLTDIDSHRRAGSQFRIEEVDGEWAHWERRMYCLSPRSLLDETRYKRVTPSIAAPAAHADATPEPAKPCESCGGDESTCGAHGCPGGKIKTCPTCEWAMSDCACTPPAQEAPKQWKEHARCGFPIVSSNREAAVTAVGKHQATCEKCSAQEAPKAAPVCSAFSPTPHGPCAGNLLERARYNGKRLLCDRHYLAFEANDFEAMNDEAKPTGVLRDPTIGERLPRPQLAADWVEDCLPTVWR